MKRIFDKITQSDIDDSEIIQETESVKRNDPKFDINLRCDYRNCSSLMRAVDQNRKDLVEYLLSIPGINVNQRDTYNSTTLHFCVDISILRLLLSRKDLDVNIQNVFGYTGLYNFFEYGHGREACVKEYLLDARVDTLIRDNNEKTVLDYALEGNIPDIVKIIWNSRYTTLLRIPNKTLIHDIVRMIIEEYT